MSVDGGQVFIAFYRDSAEAARREPEIRRNAEDFNGVVTRQGSVTIVWSKPPSPDDEGIIEGCAYQ